MTDTTPAAWILADAVLADPAIHTAYAYGPPGVGKTFAAMYSGGAERIAGVQSLTITLETTSVELRGHWISGPNGMSWHDGPVTTAFRNGSRLVLNEVSNASAEALGFLYSVLDRSETAAFTLPTGETVKAAPGFHCVMTDNYPPDSLPPALRDRVVALLYIDRPHPAALARVHESMRAECERCITSTDESVQTGLRQWINLTEMAPRFGFRTACDLAFGEVRGESVYHALRLNGCDWNPAPETHPAYRA